MAEEKPHLVLLDLMLPGSDGIELMNRILRTADVPVIFVSVYGQDEVIVRAFDMGAADYVVKPFSPTELAARIRAALRRRAGPHLGEPSEPYTLGDLSIDYAGHRVAVAGRPVSLTPTEYELLFELSVHAGRVLTHDQLLQRVWGLERTGETLAGPRGGEEAPAQAGRRRQQPRLHLHRAQRRLPHGEGGGTGGGARGGGGPVTVAAPGRRNMPPSANRAGVRTRCPLSRTGTDRRWPW